MLLADVTELLQALEESQPYCWDQHRCPYQQPAQPFSMRIKAGASCSYPFWARGSNERWRSRTESSDWQSLLRADWDLSNQQSRDCSVLRLRASRGQLQHAGEYVCLFYFISPKHFLLSQPEIAKKIFVTGIDHSFSMEKGKDMMSKHIPHLSLIKPWFTLLRF